MANNDVPGIFRAVTVFSVASNARERKKPFIALSPLSTPLHQSVRDAALWAKPKR